MRKLITLIVMSLASVSLSSMAAHEPRDENVGEAPTYTVVCAEGAAKGEMCQVSKEVYVGWRTYAVNCQVCHGGGGLGSTFAPNLLDRINKEGVDYPRFVHVIRKGYSGNVGVMPAWEKNRAVMKDLDNIYAYLKARADDKLPNGRPKRMK